MKRENEWNRRCTTAAAGELLCGAYPKPTRAHLLCPAVRCLTPTTWSDPRTSNKEAAGTPLTVFPVTVACMKILRLFLYPTLDISAHTNKEAETKTTFNKLAIQSIAMLHKVPPTKKDADRSSESINSVSKSIIKPNNPTQTQWTSQPTKIPFLHPLA